MGLETAQEAVRDGEHALLGRQLLPELEVALLGLSARHLRNRPDATVAGDPALVHGCIILGWTVLLQVDRGGCRQGIEGARELGPMQNPWLRLPNERPFLLPEDAEAVERFNRRARPERRFRMEVLPEPFLGPRDAPVVMLNLNPGFTEQNRVNHARPDFIRANRAQLLHDPAPYPFYLLDPEVSFDGGHRWWSKRLRRPIEDAGRVQVASSVLCVEYFPYHSKKSGITEKLRVPSQEYSFHLVKEALTREAIIVLLRAKALWLGAVPELSSYTRTYELNSKQNPAISPRNCPSGYAAILEAIRRHGSRTAA